MLVGALADAGANREAIVAAIASLETGAAVSFNPVKRCGIGATKFHVDVQETHAHRHLSHIVKMIEKAEIRARARQDAVAIFRKLGEAEAQVHQIPLEKVHFHEVGAADSIADIVGAAVALDSLDVSTVSCSPVNVGSGADDRDHSHGDGGHTHSVPNLNGSASHAFYTSGSGGTYTVPGQAPSTQTAATCHGAAT